MRPALLLLALATTAPAQWTLQPSGTTASLRGIHAVSDQIAWASGTSGTVLHTTDGGAHWLPCATPPQAEHLDFRGVQAFDAQTAIVMSSGLGDLSRLYKTTDSCQTWTLVFTNPDPEGFWDAIQSSKPDLGDDGMRVEVIGDPVAGSFVIFSSFDSGDAWTRWGNRSLGFKMPCGQRAATAAANETLFAASNQSLIIIGSDYFLFVTGGNAAHLHTTKSFSMDGPPCWQGFASQKLPIRSGNSTSGAFAVAINDEAGTPTKLVAVGGDYTKPDDPLQTSVCMVDNHDGKGSKTLSKNLAFTQTPPHGYRSSVAYNPTQKSWITVGPNGTDLSTDDGRNWHPLRPAPTDAPDADRNWNALSLPFVVGPNGRIGHLNPQP